MQKFYSAVTTKWVKAGASKFDDLALKEGLKSACSAARQVIEYRRPKGAANMWVLVRVVNGRDDSGADMTFADQMACEAAARDFNASSAKWPAQFHCKQTDWALNNSGQPPMPDWPEKQDE